MRLSAHASQSRNPHHPVQMLGHDLHAQHLDFGRELGNPPKVRLNRPSEFAQDDCRFRFVQPSEDRPRAIVEHERDQIGSGTAIIPIAAPARHAVNDGTHPDPGIGIQMPAGMILIFSVHRSPSHFPSRHAALVPSVSTIRQIPSVEPQPTPIIIANGQTRRMQNLDLQIPATHDQNSQNHHHTTLRIKFLI